MGSGRPKGEAVLASIAIRGFFNRISAVFPLPWRAIVTNYPLGRSFDTLLSLIDARMRAAPPEASFPLTAALFTSTSTMTCLGVENLRRVPIETDGMRRYWEKILNRRSSGYERKSLPATCPLFPRVFFIELVRAQGQGGMYVAGKSVKNSGLFPSTFNVATKADIFVNATCGEEGPETFCKPSESSRCAVCDSRSPDPGKRHNITHVLDSNPARWWQSPTLAKGDRYEFVTVILDLKQAPFSHCAGSATNLCPPLGADRRKGPKGRRRNEDGLQVAQNAGPRGLMGRGRKKRMIEGCPRGRIGVVRMIGKKDQVFVR
ncbi:hypothetical protein KM043_014217 [Ampulex compressa]|nr:hypothetical protein KM043_014217 [Ampulex compressa]